MSRAIASFERSHLFSLIEDGNMPCFETCEDKCLSEAVDLLIKKGREYLNSLFVFCCTNCLY